MFHWKKCNSIRNPGKMFRSLYWRVVVVSGVVAMVLVAVTGIVSHGDVTPGMVTSCHTDLGQ